MGVGPPPPTTTTTVQRMTGSDDETDEEMQRALAAVKAQFKKKEMIKKEKMQHAFDSASANIQTIALQSVQKYQENIEAALEKYSTDKDQLMAERHNIFAQIKAHHDKIVNLYDAFSKEATKLCKEDQNDLCVFQDLMEACRGWNPPFSCLSLSIKMLSIDQDNRCEGQDFGISVWLRSKNCDFACSSKKFNPVLVSHGCEKKFRDWQG
ncbi:hypothetical protein BC830DRAFT_1157314 [Chytriomyces sp. MP71]|nr:hypothetical protein BC830DRAFT_1157314 [Chytriomyces sp. MP71]